MPAENENEDKSEGITSVYANSTLIEQSIWDLKFIFGQLFKSESGTFDVDWHTEVTLPWPQVKLLSYYLQANLAVYEAKNGTIRLPQNLHPMAYHSDSESDTAADKTLNEKIERLRRDFINGMS
jgi:hypothetical protein